ncbi:MAG: VanZ family protein, partial [Longimicrobiales bacterium]
MVLFATLVPTSNSVPIQGLCVICGSFGVADLLVNVAMLLPLGVVLSLRWPGWKAVTALAWLPLGIEAAQMAIPGRHPTLSDAAFNVIGMAIGYGLGRVAPRLEARVSGGLLLSWSAVVAAVLFAFGLLRTPALPESEYFLVWNPSLTVIDPYLGSVIGTQLDGEEFSPGGPTDGKPVREALKRGRSLTVRFPVTEGPSTGRPLGIVGIWDDQQREVFLLGLREGDLFARGWSHADEWKMRSWSPVIREAGLATVNPGAVAEVATWLTAEGHYCVSVAGVDRCDTMAPVSAWWTALFVVPSDVWVRRISGAISVLLMVPIGLLPGTWSMRLA